MKKTIKFGEESWDEEGMEILSLYDPPHNKISYICIHNTGLLDFLKSKNKTLKTTGMPFIYELQEILKVTVNF